MRFSRDRIAGTIKISQQAVAENIVAKVGVTSNRDTPMSVGLKLEEFDPDEPNVTEPFRSLVGDRMWLANNTRPDIYIAMRAVARYSNAPKWVHWLAALHIVMYVRGTSDFGISFQRGCGVDFVLVVDSDFASKATDRRSVSGVLMMYVFGWVRGVRVEDATECHFVFCRGGIRSDDRWDEGGYLRAWLVAFRVPEAPIGRYVGEGGQHGGSSHG